MFIDGYRNILEHFIGGIGQAQPMQPMQPIQPMQTPQQQSRSPPNRYNPLFPGQQRYGWSTASSSSSFQGPGARPDGTSSSDQQQQPNNIRRFRYSVTTVGPDGVIHQITNNPGPHSPIPEGRQVPVPTLQDFLGIHGTTHPGFQQDPFQNGSLGMVLQQMFEGMGIHGNPGDYLRHVISFPSTPNL